MGNGMDTSCHPDRPLHQLCFLHPEMEETFRRMSGGLFHKLGKDEWPEGGYECVIKSPKCNMENGLKKKIKKCKRAIQLWIDHCNKEKARSLTASWQSNALKQEYP